MLSVTFACIRLIRRWSNHRRRILASRSSTEAAKRLVEYHMAHVSSRICLHEASHFGGVCVIGIVLLSASASS